MSEIEKIQGYTNHAGEFVVTGFPDDLDIDKALDEAISNLEGGKGGDQISDNRYQITDNQLSLKRKSDNQISDNLISDVDKLSLLPVKITDGYQKLVYWYMGKLGEKRVFEIAEIASKKDSPERYLMVSLKRELAEGKNEKPEEAEEKGMGAV